MAAPELIPNQALADLLPHERNPRRCSKGELAKLQASLGKHGNLGTLVARRLPDGGLRLLSGHQRAKALLALGHSTAATWLVDCDDQAEAEILLQLNGHAGEWDDQALASLLADLRTQGSDLEALQIDHKALDRELAALRAQLEEQAASAPAIAPQAPPASGPDRQHPDHTDDQGWQLPLDAEGNPQQPSTADEPAPAQAQASKEPRRWETMKPVTQRGDLWQLGQHLLLVDDCTNALAVARLTSATTGRLLVLTDPPYCASGHNEASRNTGTWGNIHADGLSTDGLRELLRAALHLVPASAAYLFCDWRQWHSTCTVLESYGLPVRSMLVWDKLNAGLGALWRPRHELVAYACKNSENSRNKGEGGNGNVLACPRTRNVHHYTEKPIALLRALLENDSKSTRRACPVYDPFTGSGSTLLACVAEGRPFRGCEIEPRFADETIRRWQEETGETATRASDGATYDALREEADEVQP